LIFANEREETGMAKRIGIGLAAAVIAVVALLFGGVFSGSEHPSPRSAFANHRSTAFDGVTDPDATLRRLLDGFSNGDTAGFVRKLEGNVARKPADADSLTLLGLAYQQRYRDTGDPSYFALSEKALLQARAVRPDGPLLATGLATLAVARHRWNDALAYARAALVANDEDASAYGALGDALVNLGRYEEAFKAFDKMALLSPSVASYGRISYARELLGRPHAAVSALDDVFDLSQNVPENLAWARVQMGNLYFNTGRLARAETAYRKALAIVPGYVHAEAGVARVEAARGRYDVAASTLQDVLDVLPTPQYAILRGDVLTAAGREAEARQAYGLVDAIERLLSANGVRTELQTSLFDLDHDRDVSGALQRAEDAYQEAPSVNASDALAWGLYKTGRCSEALARSDQALRLGTQDALMLFHRGMIERCLGEQRPARADFARALRINPSFSLLYAHEAKEYAA
jgi:tetratricopeptide (TPR) repeat protein